MEHKPAPGKKEGLKDALTIKLVGKPDLAGIKSRNGYLAFLVTENFTIVIGNLFHAQLAKAVGMPDGDQILQGTLDLRNGRAALPIQAYDFNPPEFTQAVKEKIQEWIRDQKL